MAINLSTFGLTLFLLTILLLIILPILIGIYVYKDSRMRGMNVVLWTLLSAFAPGFVGLIIYLIVRSDSTGVRCSSCNGLSLLPMQQHLLQRLRLIRVFHL